MKRPGRPASLPLARTMPPIGNDRSGPPLDRFTGSRLRFRRPPGRQRPPPSPLAHEHAISDSPPHNTPDTTNANHPAVSHSGGTGRPIPSVRSANNASPSPDRDVGRDERFPGRSSPPRKSSSRQAGWGLGAVRVSRRYPYPPGELVRRPHVRHRRRSTLGSGSDQMGSRCALVGR